jgi:hypothetical protein
LALENNPAVNNLRDVVFRLKSARNESKESPMPFCFLEGSSGLGKTQMAFALVAGSSDTVFYLVANTTNERSQLIYLAFHNPSVLLMNCVRKDLGIIQGNSNGTGDELDVNHLRGCTLYTYGFIRTVLQHGYHGRQSVGRIGLSQLADCRNKDVLFIIDEFMTSKYSSQNESRLLRNAFRSARIPLMITGTDSRAVNLIESGRDSRSREPAPWCYLVASFPQTQESIINHQLNELDITFIPGIWSDFYRQLLLSSRPLCAHIALSLLAGSVPYTLEDFDIFLERLASHLDNRKEFLLKLDGLHGQVALTLNAYFECGVAEADQMVTPFVQSHFAKLKRVHENLGYDLIKIPGLILDGGIFPYRPTTLFPNPAEDTLLFLSLMGNQHFHPFWKDQKRVSFRTALTSLFAGTRGAVILSNAVQSSNDGMFLEALLASSVTVSSHINGLGGASLTDFLVALMYHVMPHGNADLQMTKPTLESSIRSFIPPSLAGFRIPFLAPPDTEWPAFLSTLPGSNLGSINRSRNREKIDFSIPRHFISGEAKDHKAEVSAAVLKTILQKTPEDFRLHIVLTNKMQASYFCGTRNTRAELGKLCAESPRLTTAVYLRIGDQATLVEGLNADCDDAKCACLTERLKVCPKLNRLVVFIEAFTH